MNGIIKQLKLQYRTFIGMLCAVLGGAVIGEIICYLILTLDKTTTTYCPFGAFMGMLTGCTVAYFVNMYSFISYFNLTLRFGGTRKAFLTGCGAASILRVLVALLFPYLWRLLDVVIHRTLYGDFDEIEMDILSLPPLAVVIIGLALLIVPAVLGLLIARFGKPAMFVIYFLFILPAIFSGTISDALETHNTSNLIGWITVNTVEFTQKIPGWGLGLTAGVIFCVLTGIIIGLSRGQEVKE